MPWLTPERTNLIVGTFVAVFTGALAVIAACWLVAALLLGSIGLVRWIGGL